MSQPTRIGRIDLHVTKPVPDNKEEVKVNSDHLRWEVDSEIVSSSLARSSDHNHVYKRSRAAGDRHGLYALRGDESWDLAVFDETSKRIAGDPVMRNVITNWCMLPMTLWGECERLGFDRVRAEVQRVQKMSGLGSRGAYLRTCLRNLK